MNILLKTIAGIALSLSMLSPSYAQLAPAKTLPPNAAAPLPPVAPAYPNVQWPYANPALNATSLPVVDKNAALYLPYLPWLATNMALLVNYADFFYQLEKNNASGANGPFNSLSTAATNNVVSQTRQENMEKSREQTTKRLQEQLTFDPANQINTGALTAIPGTDTAIVCASPLGGINCQKTPPSDEQFNADSIFGSLGYPADKTKNIDALISFMANLTQSMPDPGLSTDPTKRAQELQRGDVQSYILAIRTLASLQSMAVSNFNFLSKEREIIPGLGEKAGMETPSEIPLKPGTPVKDASQLQLEQYLIDKRLNNPQWYAQMNTASPVAVQRETLYVLAELQRQIFELRMVNERMLATLSTMQMAMTQMGRTGLEYQAKEIKKNIDKANKASSEGG